MARTRTLALLALVGCLLVAGCTGWQSAEPAEVGAGQPDARATAVQEGTPAAAATDGGDEPAASTDADGDGGVSEVRARPALVKTGEVVLEVDDHDQTRRALVQSARSLGGYVSDSGLTHHRDGNLTWRTGYVVLRVPSDRFADLLAATRGEGTVVSEQTSTRDVSDQLVDLEARLENLRAERDRLRAFYDRANSTEELLAIERELSEVQGRIERLEAEKRALEDRVAYSTLRVEIREQSPTPTPTPTPTPEPKYHEQSLGAAFAASVNQLVVLGRSTLVSLAYSLPYLLTVGVPLGLLAGLVGWRLRA